MNTPATRRALATALVLFAALTLSRSASAATFTVNSTGDTPDAAAGNGACADASGACTLRAAIQEANASAAADTVNITATGTINLTGALPDIVSDLKLNGPGSALLTVRRDTGGNYRIFTTNNRAFDISGMTITNGRSADGAPSNNSFAQPGGEGGGINLVGGSMILSDVVITNNRTGDGGAGTTSQGFGGFGGFGGGIFSSGALTMINVVVGNNRTGVGGTGHFAGSGGLGGGIYATGPLTMTNVTVSNNVTGNGGVATSNAMSGDGGDGGGMYVAHAGPLTMTNVAVNNNTAGNGDEGGHGGGMVIAPGINATLVGCSVSNNVAGQGRTKPASSGGLGGGIVNHGTLRMDRSLVASNGTQSRLDANSTGGGHGGGILNANTLVMTSSTVSSNTAHPESGRGGGIYNNGPATMTLVNVTVTNNFAQFCCQFNSGQGVHNEGTANVRNTIIAGNAAGVFFSSNGTHVPDVTGNFNSQGHNLIGRATAGGDGDNADQTGFTHGVNGDMVGLPAAHVDPVLGPLASNGGPTLTHALLAGSPALDAGNNTLATDATNNPLTADQRGAARVRPAAANAPAVVDIGAFEFQSSPDDVSDKATAEDTPVAIPVVVGDAATASTTVTAASSNQTLVPDANLSVTGTGGIRTLTVTPAPNQSGTAVITLTITPPAGPPTTDTFTLTVNALNDAPTFTKGANQAADEDSGPQSVAGWATNLSAGAADESAQALNFAVTANTNPALFMATPTVSTSGTLTYTPAPNAAGVATITVVLRDDGGTAGGGQDASLPQTFQITVNPINDAPSLTLPGPQTVAESTVLLFSLLSNKRVAVSDIDAQTGLVAMTITATGGTFSLFNNNGLTFSAGDGLNDATMTFRGAVFSINLALDGMTFASTRGFNGAASLSVTADDQGNTGNGGPLSATGTININVNDGGSLQFATATYSVGESTGPATINVTRTGGTAGAATVAYAATAGTASVGGDFFAASGTLTFIEGETTKSFLVHLVNDNFSEPDETVNLTLSNAGGSGELGTTTTAVLTIVNDDAPTVAFRDGAYLANEGQTRAFIVVSRGGDVRQPASVRFQTVDDPAAVPCDPTARQPDGTEYPKGAAYARCDYATTIETLTWAAGETVSKAVAIPLIDDAHVDGIETITLRLVDPQGASLGARAEVLLTVTDNDIGGQPNPIGTTPFFVRLHYLDFLSREPETTEPWSAVLNNCPDVNNTDPLAPSAECDRLRVSQSFFQSQEYQLKAIYAYLFYRVALDRRPTYEEITPDMRSLAGATPAEVFARRAQYPTTFTQRPEFAALHGGAGNQQYVDALLGRYNLQQITTEDPANFEGAAQVTLTRQQLVDALNGNTLTRAQVLRAVVQSNEVDAAEYHGAFVSAQYYGYLRRTPEQSGYDAWLRVIREDPQNVRLMVNGFMNSQEYKLRFGRQ